MSKEPVFFRCKHCGNLAGMIFFSGAKMVCCGDEMEELIPNTVEASTEKHLPVITLTGGSVTVAVGSVPHPMLPEHFIQWIYLWTDKGGQRKALTPGELPAAKFCLADGEKVLGAYEFCNLHGLWKTTL